MVVTMFFEYMLPLLALVCVDSLQMGKPGGEPCTRPTDAEYDGEPTF